MSRSRKPLAIALALVIMLAMLVPVAMAAPEWVHGIDITSPTQAAPAYVNPLGAAPSNPYVEKQGDKGFKAKFDMTIIGTQVDDIGVQIRVVDANNHIAVWTYDYIVAVTGLTAAQTTPTLVPMAADGWYDLQICVRDLNNLNPMPPTSDVFCDEEKNAVLIDSAGPGVELIKPVDGAVASGDYLMVGKAWDPAWAWNDPFMQYGGVAETWFDYCALTNWQPQNGWCGPNDASWIKLGPGTKTATLPGQGGQYEFTWDTTKVPDDHGFVRFCAQDFVKLQACDVAAIFVVNRFTVNLRPGWNLISTPLMLTNPDMDAVLSHLVIHDTVKSVFTVKNENAGEPDVYTWTQWIPGDDMTFEHGQGYWINMKAADSLTFVGAWKSMGPVTPPEYQVYEGWNLIGYTHWGEPTSHWIGDKLVADYLGMPLAPSVEALWLYNAWSETYVPVNLMDTMVKGAGYWLATSDGGNINP
jgi:hypothetical protein